MRCYICTFFKIYYTSSNLYNEAFGVAYKLRILYSGCRQRGDGDNKFYLTGLFCLYLCAMGFRLYSTDRWGERNEFYKFDIKRGCFYFIINYFVNKVLNVSGFRGGW